MPPGYNHNGFNGFAATHALHDLPQSHCGENREGILFSWLHIVLSSS